MRRFAGLVLVSDVAAPALAARQPVEQDVRAVERRWMVDAYLRHDAAMLDRVLPKEFILTFRDGRLYTREHDPLAPRQRPRARRHGVRPRVDHIARLLLDAAFEPQRWERKHER